MKTLLLLSVVTLLFSCSAETPPPLTEDLSALFDTSWALSKTWDDGKAEVAEYEAHRTVYGKRRTYGLTVITVAETFNREFNTKTDSYQRQDIFSAMKVNVFARIETDAYPYHYLTSMFFQRASPHNLYKLTSGSQEWCGNTFKRVQRGDSSYGYAFDSYWDGEGAGITTLPMQIWFEDQLMYTLRALHFAQIAAPFSYGVVPTMITNKATRDSATTAVFIVASDVVDPSLLGMASSVPQQECWRVDMKRGRDVVAKWWFSKDNNHTLMRFYHQDGRDMMIKSLVRDNYWTRE